jgi:hypothetical protein
VSAESRARKREQTAFEVWFWSPVLVMRVSVVIIYMLYVYGAVIAFIAGIPIFNLLAPEGYTSVWALLLMPAAVLAAIGSLAQRWETLEKWAALALTALQSPYVIGVNVVGYAGGDLSRQYVGVISVIAIVLPAVRFVWLASQSGKKKT